MMIKMMKLMLLAFFTITMFHLLKSMPYRVPLQGLEPKFRTLILLDDMTIKYTHSIFFNDLQSRGHDLTFYNQDITLKIFGEYLYDNIVLFAPKRNDFGSISFEDLRNFIDDGGDILFVANGEISTNMKLFAATCGVEFDKKGSVVIDHFSYDSSVDPSVQHISVVSTEHVDSMAILGDFLSQNHKSVLFQGIGHVVDSKNNLALRVLKGNPTTYSSDPNDEIEEYPENVGSDTVLVSAIQARNNARLIFTGSSLLLSNLFFSKSRSNQIFAASISKWVFGESGVLRFRDVMHHKSDGTPPDVILHEKERPDLPQTLYPDPEITRNSLVYRIKDEIVYSMIVEEYRNGKWVPFTANDMQMEFVMLDPHIRKTMTCENGRFYATFTAPDNYGIFKFRVFYRRPGYSVLHAETQVSIRPFKHNEYERFIFSAFPYYTSAISAVIGFLALSVSFLFVKEKKI